jgi:hypothetical protein
MRHYALEDPAKRRVTARLGETFKFSASRYVEVPNLGDMQITAMRMSSSEAAETEATELLRELNGGGMVPSSERQSTNSPVRVVSVELETGRVESGVFAAGEWVYLCIAYTETKNERLEFDRALARLDEPPA